MTRLTPTLTNDINPPTVSAVVRTRRRRASGVGGRTVARLAFIACFLAVWWLAHQYFLANVVPSVPSTLRQVVRLFTTADFYDQMGDTAFRVILGFAIAFTAAAIIGIAMGRSRLVESFFEIFVVVGSSQPGLFVAMILLVALGLTQTTAIIVLGYLATPLITVSFWQGSKALDRSLLDVARVFGYSRVATLRHVILPQLMTSAMSGVRTGLGITWKYVVIVESIGLTNGVGYQVTRSFQLYDLQSVIAWTICFMTVVLVIEYGLIRPLEKRVFAWRDRPAGALRAIEDPADD